MADNNFRRYQAHASEADEAASQFDRDPLAELARLIGQADPSVNSGRSNSAALLEHVAAESEAFDRPPHEGQLDTAYYDNTEQYDEAEPYYEAEQDQQAYAEPAPVAPYQYPAVPHQEAHYAAYDAAEEELPAVEEPHQLPALVPQQPEMAYAADEQWEGQPDEHWQGRPDDQLEMPQDADYAPVNQRGRTMMIMALSAVGLIVAGSASAFGYHAMFGSRFLPSMPPIIMASSAPNKIAPPTQVASAAQSDSARGSGTEQLVSREEQPVQVQPTTPPPPRVVSTVPMTAAAGAFPAAPPAGPQVVSPVFPPVTSAMAPQAPASPAAAPEPKKIHTVAIRSEPAAHGRPNTVTHPMTAPATRASADAPMSLVPSAERNGGTREARAEGGPAATQSISGGGYTVQLTSQRTEAEAQSAYRALRAKYPQELSGREPIIRRAELGARGTYYRAMVGPFGSAEAAAEVCSKLKSAGGSCIVQRN